jgi:(1->4)-alpha-D-glucan 1-alpha-D-glucosylmutase
MSFVIRWQQFTGPIFAKGVEDTALYVYHPLLSLNEVGGDPRPSEAVSREDFQAFLQNRQMKWPCSLNASTTHDTKRSEDVRARLNVLSELPGEWKDHLDQWARMNARHKEQVGGQAVPDRNEEYFLYQTLLGVWPLDQESCATLRDRVQEHLIKATREAMVHTRWTRPNQQHEDALVKFVARILSSEDNREFLHDFRQFQKKVAYFGMVNGLSQTLLKIAAPGVPDFYQGSELWDLRLVDPDNRGPVDFTKRADTLRRIVNADTTDQELSELRNHWHDGRIKLFLIWRAIRFRRDHEDLFRAGEFVPLQSAGSCSRNVTAFLRRHGSSWALAAVPRWLSHVPAKERGEFDWGDTKLLLPEDSPSHWNNILTQKQMVPNNEGDEQVLMVNDLFREFPVALVSS